MKRVVHIVDVDTVNKNGYVSTGAVRLLETKVDDNNNFEHRVVDIAVEDLIQQMTNVNLTVSNASVDTKNNKKALVGTTGSLSRFATGQKPHIVIAQLIAEGTSKALGYRIASFDGKVLKIRTEDLVKFAQDKAAGGQVPFQNAQFVGTGENAPFIRAYPGSEFLQEILTIGKAKDVKPAVNNEEKNRKRVKDETLGFTKQQLAEIEAAKNAGVDIGIIANKLFSPRAMRALWQTEAKGVSTRAFADPAYKVEVLELFCVATEDGMDVTPILNPKFNINQVRELLVAMDNGVNISSFADPSVASKEMYERAIRDAQGIWCDADVSKVGLSGGWQRREFKSKKQMQKNYEEWKKSFENAE